MIVVFTSVYTHVVVWYYVYFCIVYVVTVIVCYFCLLLHRGVVDHDRIIVVLTSA